VSSGHYEDSELAGRLQQTATHTRFWNHDAADLASMLAGLRTPDIESYFMRCQGGV